MQRRNLETSARRPSRRWAFWKDAQLLTAVLAAFVVWSLAAGTLPGLWPMLLGLALGVLLLGGHSHGDVLTIDILCRKSRFYGMNGGLKVLGAVCLLVLSVLSRSPWVSFALFFVMAGLTIAGGISLGDYLSLLTLPVVFLLLGAMALLWDFTHTATGLVSVGAFGGYFVLTPENQAMSRLVLSRAMGAVSCLYFLSLSTPMPELLAVLDKAHVPGILIDLAVLIYRYIFLMLETYRDMKAAAESRLGFVGLKSSLKTTGQIYGSLLGRSFRRANTCFDAMESRGYSGGIRFLSPKKPIQTCHVAMLAALMAAMTAAVALTWR